MTPPRGPGGPMGPGPPNYGPMRGPPPGGPMPPLSMGPGGPRPPWPPSIPVRNVVQWVPFLKSGLNISAWNESLSTLLTW